MNLAYSLLGRVCILPSFLSKKAGSTIHSAIRKGAIVDNGRSKDAFPSQLIECSLPGREAVF